ncbi:hypothetical protein Tco_0287711 [Tanacetum coccineum]
MHLVGLWEEVPSMSLGRGTQYVFWKRHPVTLTVMAAPTIPVPAKENLGDLIEIRVDIVHPTPVAAVAFPMVTVVRILTRHGEVIRGIQERLLDMPTQRWEEIEEELLTLRERK